ncbi:MAG: 2-oxoacid:acceptor oxidoreductase subunit alpha [Candidatus Latescibacteria bacterium]|nr:2-oxoacid:acceptor oxidoreductase subunit alpha [Candidatus Latescibacterota bacterium]NIM66350.1 2-oxoacid:acceptor oxidoreductase subunit alpha [Candidatus Latescibacterota bacterium]NIO02829.1 2-oxoacid:acceptor oxidoreductase subunit alpha [Candidatus Latescibacterota bacterium]NIO29964.1 2-oxoacid:acceptor oxidoreductase subunit alpha [Candidatus Latescibacterota bacterium]NIO57579.1 2-oxoacid:acceptor oxidoreductase subunit alpha [Candidatus Latescibacterota bacterium]
MQSNQKDKVQVITGNEACAEGALAAGLKFFAGYPITPSSEIAEILSLRLPRVDGRFIQMEDEIAAMGAIIGASLAGAKAMTATSGPGFSLKQENIGYAAMAEVPCVVVNVQRGGPSTGLPTLPAQGDVMQSRWGTHGDHPIIALAPHSVRETFELTIRAFNLSEMYRTPVILLMDEVIGHVNEKVILPGPDEYEIIQRKKPDVPPEEFLPYKHTESCVPPMVSFGEGYRYHVTGLCHDETGFPTNDPVEIDRLLRRLNGKIEVHRDEIIDVKEDFLDDAKIGIFAYGSTARSARRAMLLAREKGIKVGMLRPTVLWPFPEKFVRPMGETCSHVIVPEMNLGQMAHEVEWATCRNAEVVKINRVDGEPISPQQILDKILEVAS